MSAFMNAKARPSTPGVWEVGAQGYNVRVDTNEQGITGGIELRAQELNTY